MQIEQNNNFDLLWNSAFSFQWYAQMKKFSLFSWEKKIQKPIKFLAKRITNEADNQSNFTPKSSFNLQCYSKTAVLSLFPLPPTWSI